MATTTSPKELLALSNALDGTAPLALATSLTYLQKLIAGGSAYSVASVQDSASVVQTATDNGTITLPAVAAANAGQVVTIQNTAAAGAAKLQVRLAGASDKVFGGIYGASTGTLVTFGEVAGKGIDNTKATALKGDFVVLMSDGSTGWWVIGGKGVWASQP